MEHDQSLFSEHSEIDLIDLEKDPRFRYVMVFKNYGKAAGASLEHSHSQLIALPVLPRMIVSELDGAKSYYRIQGPVHFL